ncbi:MAG TPA: squalene--hopene cyclase [Solirubrobacteraceae bacterium]|nr:squalene--hopene cyclase [Solirubrobacteraceae bacterium]
MASSTIEAPNEAQVALELACEHLLSLQDEAGWWQGELQTNVTMDAEDMLLREFLGVRTTEETERSAAWIRSQQRADGTWANFHDGPGDLSTTIEAYWALRLAGDSPEDPHMQIAAEWIRAQGGIARARVFTHLWLALFGLWSWDRVPALPPEVILLPSWVPLNIYDFACWARQTIVAVSLVKAHRPVRPLGFDLTELDSGGADARAERPRALRIFDSIARFYERHPFGPLRALAVTRAERWVVRRQEADGSWGGIQPPWVYSLIALHLNGYPLDHALIRRGLEGIDGFMVEDEDDRHGVGAPAGRSRRLEACQSPVWDTALSLIALSDAGLGPDHPALTRASEWLLGEEIDVRGDWAVARPDLRPGGWAFEFENDNYPDVDDTAEVVLALLRVPGAHEKNAAVERARVWLEGMQSANGGWGAFDAENTNAFVRELPFLDFGEVIDEPSADVSAHAIEMLAALGKLDTPVARRGIAWLLDQQEADGSWFGRWGVNHVYGTGAAVPALVAAGIDPEDPCIARAVDWLFAHQNEDGGWGEDARSYDEDEWIGRGPSTASQTAWALLALHAARPSGAAATLAKSAASSGSNGSNGSAATNGHLGGPAANGRIGSREAALEGAIERGIGWLIATQRADGGWDEPQYTGTGFPSDYYINYHLYRLAFPIMALGRCRG